MAITHPRGDTNTALSGADITIDLTADAVDDLAIVTVHTGATVATPPAGWTVIDTQDPGGASWIGYRVKESGDTTFVFEVAGVEGSQWALDVFRDAAFNEKITAVATPSDTVLAWSALTIIPGHASYLIATWAGAATTTPPTGWTELQDVGTGVSTSWDDTPGGGSIDPPDGALSAARIDHVCCHIELTDTSLTPGGRMLMGVG